MSGRQASWIQGELLGTFLLVFFGCGSVATSVALGANMGLFQVAIVWGLGLSIAIYLTGALSGAHLNPAITFAFVVCQGFPLKRALGYVAVQFAGAFLAAAAVYALFGGAISAFELDSGKLWERSECDDLRRILSQSRCQAASESYSANGAP